MDVPVSFSDAPPAIQAPAPNRESSGASDGEEKNRYAPDGGFVGGRFGLLLGGGSSGLAAAYAFELDFWPLSWLGLGAEWTGGGSAEPAIYDYADSDSFQAGRLRLSYRQPLVGPTFFVGTIAGGYGDYETSKVPSCAYSSCNPETEGYDVSSARAGSVAFEAALYGRAGDLTLGFAARLDYTGPVSILTFGPTLGFEI